GNANSLLGLQRIALTCLADLAVVVEDELLELRMPRESLEVILFHFLIGTIRVPSVLSHSVNRSHDAGTVTSSLAVHVNRPVIRIIHKCQELIDGSLGRSLGGC